MKKIEKANPREGGFLKSSIRSDLARFEHLLLHDDKLTEVLLDENQNLIDINSFVDYVLLQEVFKNVDGYRRSAYFYKEKDGQIKMGPLWDFNLAMGNLSFYEMGKASKWLYKKKHGYYKNTFWFKNLIQNKVFREKLIERFHSSREEGGILHYDSISALVDEQVASLKGSIYRDHTRWKSTRSPIESLIFTTRDKGESTKEHISILKWWLKRRLMWMTFSIHKIHK